MKIMKKILIGLLTSAMVLIYMPELTLSAADEAEAEAVSADAVNETVESTETTDESTADFDSDAALLKYLSPNRSTSTGRGPRRVLQRTQRSTLTANEQAVYDKTLDQIKSIIDGNSNDGSTQIHLTCADFTGNATFTFSDLGINYSGTADTDKANISAALKTKLSFDQGKVTSALTADYPEYFFWFGRKMETSMSLSYSYSNESIDASKSTVTFSLQVAGEYAKDSETETGKFYIYIIDTTKVRAIDAAKQKVKEIVDAAASLDDYSKLKSYIATISSLNTYNTAAAHAGDDYVQSYSGPWEIIDVFDGDNKTNVVCEGYAKSFKFLIDNSTFTNDVSAYTVSGDVTQPSSTSDNGVAGGPHMWNLVRINGVSYHADPTFCDMDAAGGYTLNDFLPATTKTSNGYTVTWSDYTVNGYSYSGSSATYVFDSDTTSIYTPEELTVSTEAYVPTIPVTAISLPETLALTYGTSQQLAVTYVPDNATNKAVSWTSSDTAVATVDDSGNVTPVASGTTIITATLQGDPTKTATCTVTVTVPVTSIKLSADTLAVAVNGSSQLTATVSPEGASNTAVTWTSSDTTVATVSEDGTVTGHKAGGTATITAASAENGSIFATCTVTVGNYTFGAWTSDGANTHTRVAEEDGTIKETQDHVWNKEEITKPATCEEAGSKTLICTTCGETKTVEIPALGHAYGDWQDAGDGSNHQRICANNSTHIVKEAHKWDAGKVTKAATCTETGTTTFTCTVCGATKTETIEATGHTWGAWKNLGNGKHQRICQNDSAHKETKEHLFGEWTTTAATCTAAGHKTRTCADCGAVETETIPALGHQWDEGTITTHPTCTTAGVKTYTCTICGATRTESIAALGHDYGAWTDTGDGKTHKRICSHDASHIETAAHDWGTGVQETAPTCGSEGVMKFTCRDCHATKTAPIPATGNHTWGDWHQTKAPTCAPGEEERECTVCHKKETREVAATGEHAWSDWTTTKEATCAPGEKQRTCSKCGTVEKQAIPANREHTWSSDWTQTKAPTCEAVGEESRTCSVCNTTETRAIAALGHIWSETWTDSEDGRTHYKTCTRDESHKLTENHTFGEWTVTKEATETEAGEREHTCTVCGALVKETIPVKSTAPTNPSTPTDTTYTPTWPINTNTGNNNANTGTVVANTDGATTTITAPAGADAAVNAAVAALNTAANTGTTSTNAAPQLVTGTGWLSAVNEVAKAAESLAEVQSFISAHTNETVTVTAKPRIEVAVKSADTAKISYEITPKYDIVVTAGSDTRTISTDSKVPIAAVVTVNIPIPASFAADGTLLYVTHTLDDGSVRFYSGRVASGVLSFANPDGFSEFVVSTTKPEGFVESTATKNVFRLYDMSRGEHFYTTSEVEMNMLVKNGWRLEGVGYKTVASSDTPVYRLYNSHDGGMHFFTIYAEERDRLVQAGWKYEGISFYSGGITPVYRAYNPNSTNGEHNYTTNPAEQSRLKSLGWKDEGISWYASGN